MVIKQNVNVTLNVQQTGIVMLGAREAGSQGKSRVSISSSESNEGHKRLSVVSGTRH